MFVYARDRAGRKVVSLPLDKWMDRIKQGLDSILKLSARYDNGTILSHLIRMTLSAGIWEAGIV
jgi:hypothetical protein